MGVINGKAALPKFSYTITLSQSGGGGGTDFDQPLALPHLNVFVIMPLHRFLGYVGQGLHNYIIQKCFKNKCDQIQRIFTMKT